MNPSAHVTSVEALRRLHEALARFGGKAREALDFAFAEVRRAREAVEDRLAHWRREASRCREDVGRARADLAHRRALHQGRRTGAAEQEIALARAEARLRHAEEKVAVCRGWLVRLPDAVLDFEGPAHRLGGMLDADLRVSLALLQEKAAALEAYAALLSGVRSQETGGGKEDAASGAC